MTAAASAYRTLAAREERAEVASELFYHPGGTRLGSSLIVFSGVTLGLALAGMPFGIPGGLLPIGAVLGMVVAIVHHLRGDAGVRFVVKGDMLVLRTRRSGGRVLLVTTLEELLDVELDTGAELYAADPLTGAPPGSVDRSRIALSLNGRARFPLTADHLAPVETVEWFGRIRVFLRRQGWVPLEERGDVINAPDSDPRGP